MWPKSYVNPVPHIYMIYRHSPGASSKMRHFTLKGTTYTQKGAKVCWVKRKWKHFVWTGNVFTFLLGNFLLRSRSYLSSLLKQNVETFLVPALAFWQVIEDFNIFWVLNNMIFITLISFKNAITGKKAGDVHVSFFRNRSLSNSCQLLEQYCVDISIWCSGLQIGSSYQIVFLSLWNPINL